MSDDEDCVIEIEDFKDLLNESLADAPEIMNDPVAVGRNYTESPLPGLYVEGIGPIPTPLTEREAELIKRAALPDPRDSHCWVLPASKFSLRNSAFFPFVRKAISQSGACKGTPSLDRLVLCEAGSCGDHIPMDCQSFELLLPSRYSGAAVQFSNAEREKLLSFENSSEFSLSSIVYVQGAAHKMSPIVSGYRLSLVYTFSGYTGQISSTRPPQSAFVRALRSWKDGEIDSAPRIMIYPLDTGILDGDLPDIDDLDDDDVLRLEFAKSSVREIGTGIGVGVGSLKYRIEGEVEDDRTSSERRMHYRIDGMDEVDEIVNRPHDIDYSEDITIYTTLANVVDPDGKMIARLKKVTLKEDSVITPLDHFEEEEPDEQDFEGFEDMGSGDDTIFHTYYRYALVFFLGDE